MKLRQISPIPLWPNQNAVSDPCIEVNLLDDEKEHGVLLVVPGGCYEKISDPRTTVQRFNELGFHVVALRYRVYPNLYPTPLEDLFQAIQIVRNKTLEWRIKKGKLALLGSSAGGHLSIMGAILYDQVNLPVDLQHINRKELRPDALVLSYPVVSAYSGGEKAHKHSFYRLLGGHPGECQLRHFSWTEIRDDFPPSFLWHTLEDELVPVENTLDFANLLRRWNIAFELHIFPRGPHGLGIGKLNEYAEVRIWTELCATWLKKQGF